MGSQKTSRTFDWKFKEEVAKRILKGESLSKLSRELKISRSKLYKWRDQYRQGGANLWPRADGRPPGGVIGAPADVSVLTKSEPGLQQELEHKIVHQQRVIDFLQEALRRVEGGREQTKKSGANDCSPISER